MPSYVLVPWSGSLCKLTLKSHNSTLTTVLAGLEGDRLNTNLAAGSDRLVQEDDRSKGRAQN